jgi:hypothetical protein
MTKQSNLNKTIRKYAHLGIFKGAEFLIPPQYAYLLLNELALSGIVTLGITTWVNVYSQGKHVGIAEALAIEFNIPDDILELDNASEISNNLAQEFVNQVAEKIDYISIDLYCSLSWVVPNN